MRITCSDILRQSAKTDESLARDMAQGKLISDEVATRVLEISLGQLDTSVIIDGKEVMSMHCLVQQIVN